MSQLEAYDGDDRKLFVSFDIGTTYSGISYCIAVPGRVPEVKGVTRFPGQEQIGGNAKVPTVLFYDAEGDVKAAGAETLLDSNIEAAEVEGWSKAEWFKLRLAPNYSDSTAPDQSLPPLPPSKTVHDVLADFMRYLLSCLRAFIQETLPNGGTLWKALLSTANFAITHPNGWGGAQQAHLRAAAFSAGLVESQHEAEERIQFVTEGEASLHFCGHHGLVLDCLKDGNGVILVDAGGGTLDLSAYATNSARAAGTTFSEIAASRCIRQGSVFVTRRAEEHLRSKFKDSKWEADVPYMAQIFDKHAKLTIKNSTDVAIVKFGTFKDTDPALAVRNGQLKIPGDVAAGFFQPCIDAIYNAVLEQLAVVQLRRKRITSVYIVGGFGASPLLFARLKESLGKLDIDVCRPDTHVNKAVADGGVLFLLQGRVTIRVSRYTYGVGSAALYWDALPAHRQRRDTMYTNVAGEQRLPGRFTIILPVNTQVAQEQEFRESFSRKTREHPSGTHSTAVYVYRGTKAKPEWMDEDKDKYSVLCNIEPDARINEQATSHINPEGESYWKLEYDVVLLFGMTELKAQIAWIDATTKVEQRGRAQIIYCSISFN